MNLLLSFVLLTPAGLAQSGDDGAIAPPIPAESPIGRAVRQAANDELYFSADGARVPREPRRRTERSYAQAADHVVHPITAANYSEDGLITTDIRGIYYNQSFPRSEPVGGGSTRVYDFQGRYAVDDRLQLMVSRFGSADVHIGGGKAYDFTDLAIGVKYGILQDDVNRTYVAVGAGYEFAFGDEDTFGDDEEVRLFGAVTQGTGDANYSLSANLLFATGDENVNGDSDRLSIHGHADYLVNDAVSAVVELNYYRVLENSETFVTDFSGVDLASFGGNEDEDVFTIGLGGELRATRDLRLRIAYESPLSDNVDLFGWRWTGSAVWTF
ncbi:MAG: hypothetical protein AAFR54_10395 [Planctomycetota bacterium]